jgi:hypothetical protein
MPSHLRALGALLHKRAAYPLVDTREVGSASLQVLVIQLSGANPSEQILGPDDQRRGAVVYVDPLGTIPAWLADTQNHANAEVGAPMTPGGYPAGFELGCNGSAFVFAAASDLQGNIGVNVYVVIEAGELPDSSAKPGRGNGGGLLQAFSPNI